MTELHKQLEDARRSPEYLKELARLDAESLASSSCSALSISSEAVEIVCDWLVEEINSCDSEEGERERFCREAKDFLWQFHFTQNASVEGGEE